MWQYNAKLARVIDGDTVDLMIDLGFKTYQKVRVRLKDIDTPERGQDGFKEATAFVFGWFSRQGDKCVVVTTKTGKYGRWLGVIYAPTATDGTEGESTEVSLNRRLLSTGHAKPYGT